MAETDRNTPRWTLTNAQGKPETNGAYVTLEADLWLKLARERCPYRSLISHIPQCLTCDAMARLARDVVEAQRSSERQHKTHCSYRGQDAPCRCGYRRMTDAEIVARLRGRK
jgi:hypothetical protein